MKLLHPVPLTDLQKIINIEIIAGANNTIDGINEIHKVTPGDLTFVDHPKYYAKALASAATVILINQKEVSNSLGKTLLVSNDPFSDYNTLVQHFSPFVPYTSAVHPSAKIGDNTHIAPNVVIADKVQIGSNCIIHPNVTIYSNTVIGNNVIIHANTVIGADAFYFQKRAEGYTKMQTCGRVIIEDTVEIGAACTIDKGVSGDTIIGAGTKLDNQVHVGHGVVIGAHCLIAAQVGIAGKTIIGKHVTLWGQVGVSKDLHIGDYAVVYAQSGVPKSLEGGKVYFGSPVGDARQKMKELALVKRLPEIWDKVKKL